MGPPETDAGLDAQPDGHLALKCLIVSSDDITIIETLTFSKKFYQVML